MAAKSLTAALVAGLLLCACTPSGQSSPATLPPETLPASTSAPETSPSGPPSVLGPVPVCANRKVVESGAGNAALNDAVRTPEGLLICIIDVEAVTGAPGTMYAGKEVTRYRASVTNESESAVVLSNAQAIIVTDQASSHEPHGIITEMTSPAPDELPGRSAMLLTVTDSIPYSSLDDYSINQFGAMFWAYPDRRGR